MNGRVDAGIPKRNLDYGNNMNSLFALQDKIPAKQCISLRDPLEGIWTSNEISERFFSPTNTDYIQSEIRKRVYIRTGRKYTIENQDCTSLFVIMRAYFLQYSTNNNDNIDHQLNRLNENVLAYCVDNVYSELKMYVKYLHDASTLAVPLSTPVLSNMKNKTLEFKTWFG